MRRAQRTRRGRARSSAAVGAALAAAALAAGCGGTRQDAHEKAATYEMHVVRASFPFRQAVSRPATLRLRVRNTGPETVPNVAVTLDSLSYISTYPNLADPKRPVWVVEAGPGGSPGVPVETQEVSTPGNAQTAYVDTWALGPLAPGRTRVFQWNVVPVKPGLHTVHYAVAAGLAGKAKAQQRSGAAVRGAFIVHIAAAPPVTHVNPNTGRVEVGPAPKTP
jgi:hypothetical protein